MLTWIQLWPILGLPTLVIAALAGIPTVAFHGRLLGGGPVREWLFNHVILLPWPHDSTVAFVVGFAHASVLQEWLLAGVAALNINALLLVPLYAIGQAAIHSSGYLARKNIELKRRGARA
ncbi:MAG: hypothetical protein ACYDDO_14610 [Acidiferrobacterales bacterium]